MAVNDIIEHIKAEAHAEAEEIRKKAQLRCEEIRERTARRVEAVRRTGKDRAEEAAEAERTRVLTMARLDLRKATLAERQSRIAEAFDQAKAALTAAPDADRAAFLASLVEKAAVTGSERIVLAEADRDVFTREQLEAVNGRLKGRGLASGLTFAEEARPIAGGCILVADDYEVNCSLETLLRSARERLERTISDLLFGDAAVEEGGADTAKKGKRTRKKGS